MCMDVKSLWHTQDSSQRPRESVLLGLNNGQSVFSFSKSNRTFEWLKRVDLVKTHIISYVHRWPQLKHAVVVQNSEMCCICLCSMENFVWSIVPTPMPFTVPCVPHHCGRGASVRGRGGWRFCGGAECLTQADAGLLLLGFVWETKLETHISAKWEVVEPVSSWLIAWQYKVFWMHSQLVNNRRCPLVFQRGFEVAFYPLVSLLED